MLSDQKIEKYSNQLMKIVNPVFALRKTTNKIIIFEVRNYRNVKLQFIFVLTYKRLKQRVNG